MPTKQGQIESSEWVADGYDLQHVRITALDKKGRRAQTATDEVTFSVEGNAQIVAVVNSDINSDEMMVGNTRSLFNGTCTVILRSTSQPGPVILTASANGLTPVKLTMVTR